LLHIKTVESIEQLSALKQQYINQATAPLDGMWLVGFVPEATHYGFYQNEKLVGFCCINTDGYLLQFYLDHENQNQASHFLDSILNENESSMGKVNGAFVSTAEPQYLSYCLDSFPTFKVNSLMYQLNDNLKTDVQNEQELKLTVVKSEQLGEAIDFCITAIGAPKEWLTGYYSNLINRQELFGFWHKSRLVATGECRGFEEYQTDYADLGVIVSESERGKGLATRVLKRLVTISKSKGLKPICSTEKSNIGAQKAITKAGFIAVNRIIQFDSSN